MTRILIGTEKGLHELGSDESLLDDPNAIGRDELGWWAVTDGHKIWSSPDARAWKEVTALRGLRANCIEPLDGGAIVGTSEAHLVRVSDGRSERVRSFDRIATRDDWYTPWGGPADVRSLSRGPDGVFYANIHVGGIATSPDGSTWRATPLDIDSDVHQVISDPEKPGTAYAATAIGLATTTDGGETWAFEDEGLHAAYCRAVAIAGDTLLLSASTSHTGRKAALYRRPLAGGTFERCEKGLPEWFADNLDTYCLDARGQEAVAGTTDGKVFVSEDAGGTWTGTLMHGPPVTCVAIA